jgi:hypothetical protein
MKKTKILIEIKDGFIQRIITSNNDLHITIVDLDSLEIDDENMNLVSTNVHPDAIYENMYEAYTDKNDPVKQEIRDYLRKYKV